MKFVDGKGAMRLSYDYRDDLFDLLQQSGKRPATVTTAPLIDNTSAMDVSGGNPPYDGIVNTERNMGDGLCIRHT